MDDVELATRLAAIGRSGKHWPKAPGVFEVTGGMVITEFGHFTADRNFFDVSGGGFRLSPDCKFWITIHRNRLKEFAAIVNALLAAAEDKSDG